MASQSSVNTEIWHPEGSVGNPIDLTGESDGEQSFVDYRRYESDEEIEKIKCVFDPRKGQAHFGMTYENVMAEKYGGKVEKSLRDHAPLPAAPAPGAPRKLKRVREYDENGKRITEWV